MYPVGQLPSSSRRPRELRRRVARLSVVQAITIMYVAGFVVISIALDILYAAMNPTIRFG